MSTTVWHPLSERLAGTTGWREPVPAALERPLRAWVNTTLSGNVFMSGTSFRGAAERVVLRLNLVIPDAEVDEDGKTRRPRDDVARLYLAHGTAAAWLPDVVDAVLYLLPVSRPVVVKASTRKVPIMETFVENAARADERWSTSQRRALAALIEDARSVLRLRADGRGLERRSDPLAEAAFWDAVKGAEAASVAGSAAAHLRAAWGCVYALRPDPVKAYGETIKAVEAAAQATVEPNNRVATLGTMLGHLRGNRQRFSLVIAGPDGRGDVEPLIECMSLLWKGQSSRHGSSAPTREETIEEATMALHLAVTLVQWFASGAVRSALTRNG